MDAVVFPVGLFRQWYCGVELRYAEAFGEVRVRV